MTAMVEQSLRKFSDEIYRKVLESQKDNYKNTFLSPVSIYAAMSMVLAGSQGSTKQEMLSALQLATGVGDEELHTAIGSAIDECFKSTPGVTVSVGNRLFTQANAEINPNFKSLLLKKYSAESESVDFAGDTETARQRINEWVSDQTKGKIKELFAPGVLTPDTCVAITNALYFKGSWETEFPKYTTTEGDFRLLNGGVKKMDFMYNEASFKLTFLEDLDSVAVKSAFRQSKWEMLIVLPNQTDGLKVLLPKLYSGALNKVLNADYAKCKIIVRMPRFKLSENEGIDAKAILMKLGMNAVFSRGTADLKGICTSRPLFVSNVKHKAVLEVDEEGATAAAATGTDISLDCYVQRMKFNVDHPFFVALVYDGTLPIFLGHVTDPEYN